MRKLLLLEDDISLIDGLAYSLKKNGFDIEIARTIKEAERLIERGTEFALFLFDVTLPDGNGFTLCEKLRESGNPVPIIFLTASDEETSVIRGLDCGGDGELFAASYKTHVRSRNLEAYVYRVSIRGGYTGRDGVVPATAGESL